MSVHTFREYVAAVLSGVVLCPLLNLPVICQSQPGEEAQIKAVVNRFFAAYQRKDVEALMALWISTSPGNADALKAIQQEFAPQNWQRPDHLESVQVNVERDSAAAWLTLQTGTRGTDKATVLHRVLDFVRLDSDWKISKYGSSEDELAAAFVAETAAEKRQALIDRHKDLVSKQLDEALLAAVQPLINQAQYERAQAIYEMIAQIAAGIKDQLSVAHSFRLIGNAWMYRSRPDMADGAYQRSLENYQALGDKQGMARVLSNMGVMNANQGKYQEAKECYQKSLRIDEEIGDYNGMAFALTNLISLQKTLGEYADAAESARKLRKAVDQAGYNSVSPQVLQGLGSVYYFQRDYQEALFIYQKELDRSKELGDLPSMAVALDSVGMVMSSEGNYSDAYEKYQQALKLLESLGVKPANVLNHIGIDLQARGNYLQALRYYERASEAERQTGDKLSLIVTLKNIATIYSSEANTSQTIKYTEMALDVASHAGVKVEISNLVRSLAWLKGELSDPFKARAAAEEDVKLAEQTGDPVAISGTLVSLSDIERGAADFSDALGSLRKSLSLSERVGEKQLIADSQTRLAEVYVLQGNFNAGIEAAQRAVEITRQMGLLDQLARALLVEANGYHEIGKLDIAKSRLAEAIAAVEKMRDLVAGTDQDRQVFLDHEIAPYRAMTGLLIEQDIPAEAFTLAELSKARALLDELSSSGNKPTKSMSREEMNREQTLNSQLVSLNAQILNERISKTPDEQRLAGLNAKLEQARADRDDYLARVYAAHPELRIQRADVEPISVAECGYLLPDENSAILEFAVCNDQTDLFVITKKPAQAGAVLTAHRIDIKPEDLANLCGALRNEISQRGLDAGPLALKLYQTLLSPAAPELKGKNNLIIVPDGPLWELPFQALLTGQNHYLIEDLAISYAPSLTALREMSKREHLWKDSDHPATELLALGNPALGADTAAGIKEIFMDADLSPLPQAEQQVRELQKLYGPKRSSVYTGADATEDRLKSEASSARILHLAAHGILNDASPMYSQIVLARAPNSPNDGLLEAWEVMNMNLHADVAVLAACDTARGKYRAGEGVVGLSWAFFVAGCPTTVVSQWSVEAQSTTNLMIEFHRNMLAGLSKAESLRRAELKLLKGDVRYRNPFYWAPFVVIGAAN